MVLGVPEGDVEPLRCAVCRGQGSQVKEEERRDKGCRCLEFVKVIESFSYVGLYM